MKRKLSYLAIYTVTLAGCMLDTDSVLAPSSSMPWSPPSDALHAAPAPKQTEPSPLPASAVTPSTAPALPASTASAVQSNTPKGITELIDEALSENPLTQKAWWSAKEAAARELQAYSVNYPSVTAADNLQRQRIETIGVSYSNLPIPMGSIIQNRTTYGPMLDVSYTLFTFGAQTAEANAAREALYAANFQYNRELQTVVLATEQHYYALHAALSAVAAEQASLQDAQAALDAAETKNRVGLSPIQDVLKAKSNYLEELYRLQAAESLVETARASLAQVLGREDVGSVQIKAPEILPMPEAASENIQNLIKTALEQRPDVQAAHASVRASESQNLAARRSLLPQIVSGVSGDLTNVRGYSGTEDNYLAYVRAQWNIFDGFRKEARVIETKSQLEAAKRNATAMELAAISDVWTQYFDFKSARDKLSSAQGLVSASEATYSAIDTGYKTGLNSILDHLTAQRDLATARLTLIRAQTDYTTSIAKLANSLGEMPETPPVSSQPASQ